MKTATKFAPFLLAALAAASLPAMADDDRRGGWRDRDHYSHRDRDDDDRRDRDRRRWSRDDDRRWDRDDDRRGHRDGYWRDGRWYSYSRDRRYHPNSGHWDNGRRGPPPWARGRDYRSYGYQQVYYVPVSDYGRYRLHRPDYGYRWVRDDRNTFLLIAAATGVISQILSPGY